MCLFLNILLVRWLGDGMNELCKVGGFVYLPFLGRKPGKAMNELCKGVGGVYLGWGLFIYLFGGGSQEKQ